MILLGLLAAGVLLVVLFVAMSRHRRVLASAPAGTPRIIPFELAGSGRAAHRMLSDASTAGRTALRRGIAIDRWIIAGYGLGLAALSLVSIWVIQTTSHGTVEVIGISMAIAAAAGAIIAGLFDVRENGALTEVLDAWSDPVVPDGASPLEAAAVRQAHRRRLIGAMDRPSAAARRAALAKFGALGAVAVWGLTVGCIAVTHYAR